jgi:hypothetical protein
MPKFEAQGVVEALEWDFNPYVAARGIAPEPTDAQIAAFLTSLKGILKGVRDSIPEGISDPAMIVAAMDDMDPEETIRQMASMCQVYADLCSGTPSAEQIGQLPMRVRTIFFAWLQGEVMSPEAVTPGGNAEVRSLPVGRAG